LGSPVISRAFDATAIAIQFTGRSDYQLCRPLLSCITDEPLKGLMEISAAGEYGLTPWRAKSQSRLAEWTSFFASDHISRFVKDLLYPVEVLSYI